MKNKLETTDENLVHTNNLIKIISNYKNYSHSKNLVVEEFIKLDIPSYFKELKNDINLIIDIYNSEKDLEKVSFYVNTSDTNVFQKKVGAIFVDKIEFPIADLNPKGEDSQFYKMYKLKDGRIMMGFDITIDVLIECDYEFDLVIIRDGISYILDRKQT